MLKISDCFTKFTSYTSPSEVVISRCVDICGSFLHISLQKNQIEYRETGQIIIIKKLTHASRFILEKEIITVLQYINDHSNDIRVQDILCK